MIRLKEMIIAFFEAGRCSRLYPLTLTKPVYMLRCGALRIYEKAAGELRGRLLFLTRSELGGVLAEKLSKEVGEVYVNELRLLSSGDDLLVVDGGWLFDESLLKLGEEVVAAKDGELVYAYVKGSTAERIAERSSGFNEFLERLGSELSPMRLEGARLVRDLWDLIEYNAGEIERDAERIKRGGSWRSGSDLLQVQIVGDPNRVLISRSAEIYPQVVVDSREGPVIIEEGARILPFSYLAGPCYVGRGSWIVGGRVSESSIGPVCRVGGEVEGSIIEGFSNKYHAGFLGHSYVGEWVNLAAMTTTSDLKNDYSPVRIPIGGRLVDSGKLKLGAFIGDHTKTGIGSLFTAGSVIGIMCNLVSSGEPYPKYVPSFTWLVKGQVRDWIPLDRMIEGERGMMARRGVRLSDAEEKLLRELYAKTEAERAAFKEKLLRGAW